MPLNVIIYYIIFIHVQIELKQLEIIARTHIILCNIIIDACSLLKFIVVRYKF